MQCFNNLFVNGNAAVQASWPSRPETLGSFVFFGDGFGCFNEKRHRPQSVGTVWRGRVTSVRIFFCLLKFCKYCTNCCFLCKYLRVRPLYFEQLGFVFRFQQLCIFHEFLTILAFYYWENVIVDYMWMRKKEYKMVGIIVFKLYPIYRWVGHHFLAIRAVARHIVQYSRINKEQSWFARIIFYVTCYLR